MAFAGITTPLIKLYIWLPFILFICSSRVHGHWKVMKLVNKCGYDVWPGIAPNQGQSVVGHGGIYLAAGHVAKLVFPWTWQGRVWARTGCRVGNNATLACDTGDCGSGKVECEGSTGQPPATLAQFTFQPDGQLSYYDVSLVDGFNVPIIVQSACTTAGCAADVLKTCPSELRMVTPTGSYVACKSACVAYDVDAFCCRGDYGSEATCQPTVYSRMFKKLCPAAYSYAFDSPAPLYKCDSRDFTVTFCPPTSHLLYDSSMPLQVSSY